MNPQAERAHHDKLAISKKGLEDRHASKTELCRKLEERANAKAAAAKQLMQQLQIATHERTSLAAQLAALQVRSTTHFISIFIFCLGSLPRHPCEITLCDQASICHRPLHGFGAVTLHAFFLIASNMFCR